MYIDANHISKHFDNHTVLLDVSFTIKAGECVGIIGANGSGKTTLLKILAGIDQPDEGQFTIAKKSTMRYVPQAPEYEETATVENILLSLIAPQEEYKIDKALTTLGLLECKEKQFKQLSSGQKTRIYLARIIIEECDILLLDEPTNHLDIKAFKWLENHLKKFNGTICMVSHDRVFLDNVVNRIFELEDGTLNAYGGTYTFYKKQKALEQEAQQRAYKTQQKEIKRLRSAAREMKQNAENTDANQKQTRDNDKFATGFFANRASKKKAAVARSIETRLDTLDTVEKPRTDPKLKMLFTPKKTGSQIVASFDQVTYSTPEATVLSDISFQIELGERIALSGPNGVGKTTLIKLLFGQLQPETGEISLGQSTVVGYLSQEHESLQSSHTVINELTEKTEIDMTLAHRLLAWLLVSQEKMRQPVNTLSKGEQSKVLLAELIASGANFIILDEPTNHLDIRAREAVEEALREYSGTLLIISHDRYFVEAINPTRYLYLEGGELRHPSK